VSKNESSVRLLAILVEHVCITRIIPVRQRVNAHRKMYTSIRRISARNNIAA